MTHMQATKSKAATLLTGATGFIGRRLLTLLTSQGVRCKALVRGNDEFVASKISRDDVYIGELGNSIQNPNVYSDVDTIVHCAARVHNMNESSSSLLETYRKVNRDLTLDFARLSLNAGVRTFVFVSTVKVMGDFERTEKILTEEDEPKPTDPYGISKYEAEKGLVQLFSNQSKSRCIILRLPMVYGPGNKGNMLSLLKAASKRIPLPLRAARGKRSMVYVENVCDAIVRVSYGVQIDPQAIEAFFVTDGSDYSSNDLYKEIFKAMHGSNGTFWVPHTLLRLPARFNGKARKILSRLMDDYRFSSEKLQREYEWRPRFSFEHGIKETVAWYKKQYM